MNELSREHKLLKVEQDKSEKLLLNILPEEIAHRLKESLASGKQTLTT